MSEIVAELGRKVLETGHKLTREEGLELCRPSVDVHDVMYWANKIRRKFRGEEVKACSIVSVKTGACTEDCSFCAQSSKYKTNSPVHDFLPVEQVRAAAKAAKKSGSYALGLVAQGHGPKDEDLDVYVEYMKAMGEEGLVEKHINIGIMSETQIARLKGAGMVCCGHNLETSRRMFPKICSTHSYDDRVKTMQALQRQGVKICSGAIFGVGEDWIDRVDLAIDLRDLGAGNIPMNFLNRIEGTPLANARPMEPLDILRTVALYRFILFDRDLGVYGGREVNLRDLQALIFNAGASAVMIGNYLTTAGRPAEMDKQMIKDLGLKLAPPRVLDTLPPEGHPEPIPARAAGND
ncbi:MAG: biotin synthase BioB [Planctomycetota bacterium]|nr:biotin synthase BioB [Planctomycetota bacterium]